MYLARLFPSFFFSVRDDARLSEQRVRSFRYRSDERQPRRSVFPRVTTDALYRIRGKRNRRSSASQRLRRESQEWQFLRKPTERCAETVKSLVRRISRQLEIKWRFPYVARCSYKTRLFDARVETRVANLPIRSRTR